MQLLNSELAVPVYLKTSDNDPWPDDKMFYLLTKDGLFLCRNHMWFRSCSPAKTGPLGLANQESELTLSYPILPQALVEKAVAFFRSVYGEKRWESALIIVFNRQTQEIELICPEQEASFASVHYTIPTLPPHLALIGDFHSHCDFSPEPSMTDENDELNRPGLHLIAGYLNDPKPKIHCIAVADGTRFTVKDHSIVMEPFVSDKGIGVPAEWLAKIKEKKYSYSYMGSDGDYTGYGSYLNDKPDNADKEKILIALDGFLEYTECPSMEIIRTRLYACTRHCTYKYCEKRAKDFINAWPKSKEKHDQHHTQKQTAAA